MHVRTFSLALAAMLAGTACAAAQSADQPSITSRKVGQGPVDYANARPLPLPRTDAAPAGQSELLAEGAADGFDGEPGFSPGSKGSGKKKPVKLPKSKYRAEADRGGADLVAPQAFGKSQHPFTTATQSDASLDPYRRAGKVLFNDNGGTFICSASMIGPGVVVTAAHCVSEFGKRRFYSNITYIPAYRDGLAPYGVWTTQDVFVMTSYFEGKDKCATKGIVCENDVAVLVLAPQSSGFAGNLTGWFGVAWDGYGFNKDKQALITQLGYPGDLNDGEQMMRTDSQGAVDKSASKNTVIGSLQGGGSSGGPWLVNFGFAPTLSGGVKAGKQANRMVVVGATSWGFTNQAIKEQGASPFTSKNVKVLIEKACSTHPTAC